MKKTYVITFSISLIVMFSVGIIMFMLMLPQNVNLVESEATKYEILTKSEFMFNNDKDISKEALQKRYNITNEAISEFKNSKQYKAGNSDPFTAVEVQTNTGTTNNNNSNNSDNNSSSTIDKTTNSNGGTPNPSSTNK